jgi:hypothetical protein
VVTDELVDRALEIVAEGAANYHYFFANLNSPDWIAPLKRRGRFSNPPPAEIRGDSMRFPSWPEGEYLLRMATQSPQEVFDAINEKWHQSDNHSVHDLSQSRRSRFYRGNCIRQSRSTRMIVKVMMTSRRSGGPRSLRAT